MACVRGASFARQEAHNAVQINQNRMTHINAVQCKRSVATRRFCVLVLLAKHPRPIAITGLCGQWHHTAPVQNPTIPAANHLTAL